MVWMLVLTRAYPSTFPAQHLRKSGSEDELLVAPMYEAPSYKGSEKLKDKVAVITGGDFGIGRAVAVLYAREGANIVIVYLEEHEDARATKEAVETEGRRCHLIAGDVSDAMPHSNFGSLSRHRTSFKLTRKSFCLFFVNILNPVCPDPHYRALRQWQPQPSVRNRACPRAGVGDRCCATHPRRAPLRRRTELQA